MLDEVSNRAKSFFPDYRYSRSLGFVKVTSIVAHFLSRTHSRKAIGGSEIARTEVSHLDSTYNQDVGTMIRLYIVPQPVASIIRLSYCLAGNRSYSRISSRSSTTFPMLSNN